jgi:hypothetical protein
MAVCNIKLMAKINLEKYYIKDILTYTSVLNIPDLR